MPARALASADPVAHHPERAGGRQLEVSMGIAVAAPEVGHPHRAVDRCPADGSVALGDDLACAPAQRLLAMGAEQMKAGALDLVEHAGMALAGTNLANDRVGGVGLPVDRAQLLAHQRARLAGHLRISGIQPLGGGAPGHLGDRLDDCVDRGATDFVAVEAALPHLASGEAAVGPDVTGVGLAIGLEHGHAPLGLAELNRPIERGGPAVALRTGMHDQAAPGCPDRLRDELLEHGTDDQIGPVALHRGLHLVL